MYARCPANSRSPSSLGDQVRDLRRHEARELRALALDCVEEPGVGERDGGLVGEGLNEGDVVVGERPRLTAHKDDDANQVVLDEDRDAEHRSEESRARIGVFGILEDIWDLDGPSLDGRTAGRRAPIDSMRMIEVVLRPLGLTMVCPHVQDTVLKEPERPMVGLAQSPARLGHLLENRLQPGTPSDRAENAADRVLLLTHVLELMGEVRAVPRAAGHSFSLSRRRAPPGGRSGRRPPGP